MWIPVARLSLLSLVVSCSPTSFKGSTDESQRDGSSTSVADPNVSTDQKAVDGGKDHSTDAAANQPGSGMGEGQGKTMAPDGTGSDGFFLPSGFPPGSPGSLGGSLGGGPSGSSGSGGSGANSSGGSGANGGSGGSPGGSLNGNGQSGGNITGNSDSSNAGSGGGNGSGGSGGLGGSQNLILKVPRFAMLVNDLKCAMCHLTVAGNVASTSPVRDWSDIHVPLANEKILGGWYASDTWSNKTPDNKPYPITISTELRTAYRGPQVPNVPGHTDQPIFPTIDFAAAEARMSGELSGQSLKGAVTVNKVYNGNLVLIGSQAAPIIINGSIMVKGDLVIKGVYQGVGSIYVTGRVYIPANLVAAHSIFPFPTDLTAAYAKGQQLVQARQGDALGIASAYSVFIADLTTGLYDHALTPPDMTRKALLTDSIYSWYPGGKTAYETLYETGIYCQTNAPDAQNAGKSFNRIDAFLYARQAISGISRHGSWSINGGVIANGMHVLGEVSGNASVAACPAKISPVHGQAQDRNYISYDYRMSAGLRILGELAPYFQ